MRALEIGPGQKPVSRDWDSMDMISRPWVSHVHDVRKLPLPLDDGIYDLVYMSHILEHVPWFQTIDLLADVHRILRPCGTVEIWVPDFKYLMRCYQRNECGDDWRKHNRRSDPMLWLNGRLFTYGPNEENWHRAVFDRESLRGCLKAAGFKQTATLQKPRGYDHGKINLGMAALK